MPAFAAHYGLKPWEIEQLTFAEIDEFRRQLPKPPKPTKTRRSR